MKDFVIFDLETTGLAPKENQIIEIAAMRTNYKGEKISTFHKFIKLYKVEKLDPFITELTSIDEQLLLNEGEDVDYVMEEFLNYINDSILVAQNAKFDMSFLMEYYIKNLDNTFTPLAIDTIELAKVLRPNLTTYKLAKLVEYFDVDYDSESHHRADYDVFITREVFVKMLEEVNYEGNLDDLLKLCNFRNASEKQISFLESLMGKNNHYLEAGHMFSINTASFHIDYYLNR